jgi:hypothetical protein
MLITALGGAGCSQQPAVSARGGYRRAVPLRAVAAILDGRGDLVATVRGDGSITAAIPDSTGGWYVQGSFTRLDGLAGSGLARINAAGVVDPLWRPPRRARGARLGAASRTRVYLSRPIDDSDTYRLWVLDARSGQGLASRVLPGVGGPLAADARRLYVANVLPITTCIEALDPVGRRVLYRFQVHMLAEAACVNELLLTGGRLYAAGSLGIHPQTPGAAVARFDAGTGRLDRSWRAQPVPCRNRYGLAYAIAVRSGRAFVNPGAGRDPVSAISTTTGAPIRAWRPPAFAGVNAPARLALAGRLLFVLQAPPHEGGLQAGNGLIALNAYTGGTAPSWHPPPGSKPTVLAASGDRVLVGLSSDAAVGRSPVPSKPVAAPNEPAATASCASPPGLAAAPFPGEPALHPASSGEAIAVLAGNRPTTLRVDPLSPVRAALYYTSPRDPSLPPTLDNGQAAVLFPACGQQVHRFGGGIVFAGRGCARLDVEPAGEPTQVMLIAVGQSSACSATSHQQLARSYPSSPGSGSVRTFVRGCEEGVGYGGVTSASQSQALHPCRTAVAGGARNVEAPVAGPGAARPDPVRSPRGCRRPESRSGGHRRGSAVGALIRRPPLRPEQVPRGRLLPDPRARLGGPLRSLQEPSLQPRLQPVRRGTSGRRAALLHARFLYTRSFGQDQAPASTARLPKRRASLVCDRRVRPVRGGRRLRAGRTGRSGVGPRCGR